MSTPNRPAPPPLPPAPPTGPGSPQEVRVWLDFDEFVASAWGKGVRFGIDVAAVQEGIQLDRPERRVVARGKPFVAGKDATIT